MYPSELTVSAIAALEAVYGLGDHTDVVEHDVEALRDGSHTRESLLAHCLDGASMAADEEEVVRAAWESYVDGIVALAAKPRRWELVEEGHSYDVGEASSAEEALEIAKARVDRANYEVDRSIWIHVAVRREGIPGVVAGAKVRLDPKPPPCGRNGGEHAWSDDHDMVGGCKSNPGVWGSGGGVRMHWGCKKCGCQKAVDTWAQDPYDGEQGLTSVEYNERHYDVAREEP
jgi:hypothetical protein